MDEYHVIVADASVPELSSTTLGCPADVDCGDDCSCVDDVK